MGGDYCAGCKQRIERGLYYTVSNGPAFHDYCFKCSKCRRSCAHGEFYMRDGNKLFCKDDYMQTYEDKCKKCMRYIEGRSLRTHSGDTYHRSCFKCVECNKVIASSEKYVKDGTRIHCAECGRARKSVKSNGPQTANPRVLTNGDDDDKGKPPKGDTLSSSCPVLPELPEKTAWDSSEGHVLGHGDGSGRFKDEKKKEGKVKKLERTKTSKKSAGSIMSTIFRISFDLLL